jgi:multidrug efflux pump subunit AcrA (membrane-fusion protein)
MARNVDPVALALLIACSGCSASASASSAASPIAAPRVATVVVRSGVIHPSLQIAGVVTPRRQVGIAADLAEPISDVDVQEGDTVHAGQVLAHLLTDDLQAQLAAAQRVVAEDVARYTQTAYQTNAVNAQDESAIRSAQATLHETRVNLAGAATDLRRYESLEAQGYLAPETVDQQRTTVAGDTATVNSAQAALNEAVANSRANGLGTDPGEQQQELQGARAAADAAQASTEQLRRQIARAVIVSPLDGVVDAVNANPGEYPLGRQLFTIEQTSSVYALLTASSAQVVRIRRGAAATVVASGDTQKDRGTVVAVLDELQPGTTNFTVKVLVPNAGGLLHAGMPVTGSVALPAVRGLEIPVTAFVDDTRASVYAIDANVVKTAAVHEVKDDGANAIVTGIAAGTVIVKDVESENVGNGDRVTTAPASK